MASCEFSWTTQGQIKVTPEALSRLDRLLHDRAAALPDTEVSYEVTQIDGMKRKLGAVADVLGQPNSGDAELHSVAIQIRARERGTRLDLTIECDHRPMPTSQIRLAMSGFEEDWTEATARIVKDSVRDIVDTGWWNSVPFLLILPACLFWLLSHGILALYYERDSQSLTIAVLVLVAVVSWRIRVRNLFYWGGARHRADRRAVCSKLLGFTLVGGAVLAIFQDSVKSLLGLGR